MASEKSHYKEDLDSVLGVRHIVLCLCCFHEAIDQPGRMRNGLPFASHLGLQVGVGVLLLNILGSGSFVVNPGSLALKTSVEEVIKPRATDLDLTVK